MKIKTTYTCEICGFETVNEADCRKCEQQGTAHAFSPGTDVLLLITDRCFDKCKRGLPDDFTCGTCVPATVQKVIFNRQTHEVYAYTLKCGRYKASQVSPKNVKALTSTLNFVEILSGCTPETSILKIKVVDGSAFYAVYVSHSTTSLRVQRNDIPRHMIDIPLDTKVQVLELITPLDLAERLNRAP